MFKYLEYHGKPANRIELNPSAIEYHRHMPKPGVASIWYTWEHSEGKLYYFNISGEMDQWLKENQVDYSLEVTTLHPTEIQHNPLAFTPMGQILHKHDSVLACVIAIPDGNQAVLFKLAFGGV